MKGVKETIISKKINNIKRGRVKQNLKVLVASSSANAIKIEVLE
jgi:hypothetical protein